jgi:diaminopimelate epimerase
LTDFYKYHGLGNDYIVIDPKRCSIPMTVDNIKLICNRNFGVGSDGVLYGPITKDGRPYLQIFNPDGSEAEKSGNGIRIFARYLWDSGYIISNKFALGTKSGLVIAEMIDKKDSVIKVDMGEFSFESQKIPTRISDKFSLDYSLKVLDREFVINCVTIGNPHCVVMVDKTSADLAKKYGAVLENYNLFPNRINVQFVEILDRNNIRIEIWERGAGYTLASGSSSVASACVAYYYKKVDKDVVVHMAGGSVQVTIEGNRAYLTGSVKKIAEGKFAEELL